jgi:hypothetical protein
MDNACRPSNQRMRSVHPYSLLWYLPPYRKAVTQWWTFLQIYLFENKVGKGLLVMYRSFLVYNFGQKGIFQGHNWPALLYRKTGSVVACSSSLFG